MRVREAGAGRLLGLLALRLLNFAGFAIDVGRRLRLGLQRRHGDRLLLGEGGRRCCGFADQPERLGGLAEGLDAVRGRCAEALELCIGQVRDRLPLDRDAVLGAEGQRAAAQLVKRLRLASVAGLERALLELLDDVLRNDRQHAVAVRLGFGDHVVVRAVVGAAVAPLLLLGLFLAHLDAVAGLDVGDLNHDLVEVFLAGKLRDDVGLHRERFEALEHEQRAGLVDAGDDAVLDPAVVRGELPGADDGHAGNLGALDLERVHVLLAGIAVQHGVADQLIVARLHGMPGVRVEAGDGGGFAGLDVGEAGDLAHDGQSW